MGRFFRTLALVAGLALLVYGIFQPFEHEVRWLLCLWGGVALAGISLYFTLPAAPRGMQRSVQNLAFVFGAGFAILSLQLLRQQVILQATVYAHVETDERTGQVISNIRPVLQNLQIQRGTISDRNNLPLVSSEVVAGGSARRLYPLAERYDPRAFSHVVGFVSPRFGQSGLEASYSEALTGSNDEYERLLDAIQGRQRRGNNLLLTIDAELQARTAALLGERRGSVVVLDPRSGAIYALVSVPGFDPRRLAWDPTAQDLTAANEAVGRYWSELNDEAAGQPLLNRAIQGLYPPGSTFKTVTAVTVLQHPAEGIPESITCPNEFFTGEAGAPAVVNAVPDLFTLTGEPSVLERVYAYSCNTAFAQFGLRVGAERLARQSELFDIFSPQEAPANYSGFEDLPTEASLLYVTPGFLERPSALADTSFGQGQLLVTPLQMALVGAAIANQGTIMQPYLVQRVSRPDGTVVSEHRPQVLQRNTMRRETAARMLELLRAGVSYGFGRPADIAGLNVGGKSGTAEIGDPNGATHAWFLAVAPIAPEQTPRFVVLVMLERGGSGAGPAAQLAGEVMAAAFATIPEQ